MSSFEALAKQLQEKSATFGTQIDRVKRLNTEMREKVDAFVNALTALRSTVLVDTAVPRCGICVTRVRSHCFVPCGHVVCDSCSRRANQRNPPRCFTCRQTIQDTQRIYL
jgi:hypothetical protein